MPATCTMLDLSTAHLNQDSRDWLDRGAEDASQYKGCYGWVSTTYPDPENPGRTVVTPAGDGDADMTAPPALAAIFAYACANGCDFVLFDADRPVNDDLSTFDEDEA